MGRDHEGQLVAKDLDGGELRLLGNEGGDAEVEAIVQELAGNVAREGAADGQMDLRVHLPIAGQDGEQGVDGAFVDAEGELAAAAGAEVVDGAADFVAKIEDALGVADQEAAGVGELAGTGAAGEEGLADLVLQLADGDADGGLGAEELLCGAREAAFAGHGEQDVEFGEVHRALQP